MRKDVAFVLVSIPLSVVLAVRGHADTLQSWFDMHGYSINAATDELGIERFEPGLCVVTVLNGEHAYLNLTGWYSAQDDKRLLFGGVPEVGATDSFAVAREFGFYIDSGYGIFHTETALNEDGFDHACVFGNSRGAGYIVAFEDMMGGGDRDYTDRIILVTVTPFGPWHVDCSVRVSGDGRSWPTAFKTIEEGIDAAGDGEEIIVARGTYYENIRFTGENVYLHSTNPADPSVVAKTVIDGGQRGPVVTFEGGETAECLLLGFTIQNGSADYGGGICGGTEDRHTHATIRKNTITQNSAAFDGGGIAFLDGSIENNVISGNSAGDQGGGLYDCQGAISNNRVTGNTASYSGGGLHWCHGVIEHNTISANSAGRGGGLDCCDGLIQNNTIEGNSANLGGGGLAWCEGTVQGNVIRANSAFYGGGLAWGQGTIQNNLIVGNLGEDRGGGLEACDGTIQNNTIVDNLAGDLGGGLADCAATITNCIIWANSAAHFAQLFDCSEPCHSCIEEWSGGEGNFSRSPGFLDADGADDDPKTYQDNDYHLTEGSPCIDVGKNEDWMGQAVDMDGNRRIFFGLFSLTVDVGAYEYGSASFWIVQVVRSPNGGVELTWKSSTGRNYTIWSCYDLVTGAWVRETPKQVPAAGEMTTWIDTSIAVRCKFYKIEAH